MRRRDDLDTWSGYPVAFSAYLTRQNARDPSPRQADVYERANEARPGFKPFAPAPYAVTVDRVEPSSQTCISPEPIGEAPRRYGAPHIGDVTPTTPALHRAGAPAPIARPGANPPLAPAVNLLA